MRPLTFTTRVFIPLAILGTLAACSGGGSSAGNGVKGSAGVPVTSAITVSPADSPLSEFKPYTFTASATDSAINRSVAGFIWNFGDGTAPVTDPASFTSSVQHAFQAAGIFTVHVQSFDDLGNLGNQVSLSETVAVATTPVTVTAIAPAPAPAAAPSIQVVLGGTTQFLFVVHAVSTNAGASFPVSGFTFSAGDAGAVVDPVVSNGGGTFTIPVHYPAAAQVGSRTAQPTLTVADDQGSTSAQLVFQPITILTTGANHAPTVLITTPATPSTSGFTSKPVDLTFTLTDPDGDKVSYTVDWGDGTPLESADTTTADTRAGVSFTLHHAYADAFASAPFSNPHTATATIAANDGRTGLDSKSCSFSLAYNTYPAGFITSPQASGTLPSQADLPDLFLAGLRNPPTATSPDLVVIPNGGLLSFNATAQAPGSGDATLSYTWNFPNGSPSSSTLPNPQNVAFTGTDGQVVPCLVTLTVTDAFNRSSTAAPGLNAKTFQKWVIVDGKNTQHFNLAFLYRQKSDNNGVATLTPVQTVDNGLGASVQIFQDGSSSAWPVGGVGTTNQATVAIPVRSNLPFYVEIPSFTKDARSYMLEIPNAPTGPYRDPDLETNPVTHALPAGAGFGFADPAASATPWWGPTLRVVTAQGFAPETSSPAQRKLQGTVSRVIGKTPVNSRWVDRISVTLADPTAVQWQQDSNSVGEFSDVSAYQSFAEWPMVPLSIHSAFTDPADSKSTTQGKAKDLGFNVVYNTYANSDTQASQTFMTNSLQAYRVPADTGDPYFLTDGSITDWGTASCTTDFTPTPLIGTGAPDYTIPTFFHDMIYGQPGTAALNGGIQNFPVPYLVNDPDRIPLTLPQTQANRLGYNGIRSIFAYSEYLWSSVWARPIVLNNASLNFVDSWLHRDPNPGIGDPGNPGLSRYPFLRYSQPVSAWPKFLGGTGILPDHSWFDLTAVGGPAFDASSPVSVGVHLNPVLPSTKAVGRFYWTAYTPSYTSAIGSVISRTWLADGAHGDRPPTTFNGQPQGDATAAFGFVPPQLMKVDKRGRNADGSLSGQSLGGYRMTWFNPTVDANGDPVPPDFWVVEIIAGATNSNPNPSTVHFMLPGSFPAKDSAAPSDLTQTPNALVLTDARAYLPSHRAAAAGPALSGGVVTDLVAPGSCWVDVPPELRPATGNSATITVYALKAILRNNPVAQAHALNRTDWIDAIKTAQPQIKIVPGSGLDVSDAHKIPFNFPWDIVVVNGPATPVAP